MQIKKHTFRENILKIIGGEITSYEFRDTKPNVVFIYNNSNSVVQISNKIDVKSFPKLSLKPSHQKSYINVLGMNSVYFYSSSDIDVYFESYEVDEISPKDIPEYQSVDILTSDEALGSVVVSEIVPVDISSMPNVVISGTPHTIVDTGSVSVSNVPHVIVDSQATITATDCIITNLAVNTTPVTLSLTNVKALGLKVQTISDTNTFSISTDNVNYISFPSGAMYERDNLFITKNLYVKANTSNVLEVITWV